LKGGDCSVGCVDKTDGNRLTTKQTRQITRVGGVGSTNYPLSKVPAGTASRSIDVG